MLREQARTAVQGTWHVSKGKACGDTSPASRQVSWDGGGRGPHSTLPYLTVSSFSPAACRATCQCPPGWTPSVLPAPFLAAQH